MDLTTALEKESSADEAKRSRAPAGAEPKGEQRVLELEPWGGYQDDGGSSSSTEVKVQQAVEEELRRLMAKKASRARAPVVITATMQEDRSHSITLSNLYRASQLFDTSFTMLCLTTASRKNATCSTF